VEIAETDGGLDKSLELLFLRERVGDRQAVLDRWAFEHAFEPGLQIGVVIERKILRERGDGAQPNPGKKGYIRDGVFVAGKIRPALKALVQHAVDAADLLNGIISSPARPK
jgi:hypothetical protein